MSELYVAKIVLVGDQAVGKTSIRKRFMGFGFTKSHLTTIGADFSEKNVKVKLDSVADIKFQIWDLAGQDNFKLIRQRFLANTNLVIFVFDRTKSESFMRIKTWLEEVKMFNSDRILPLIIVGNKSDLTEQIIVSDETVNAYINSLRNAKTQYSKFVIKHYTSALTGENIDLVFESAAKYFLALNKEDERWLNAKIIE